MHTLTPDHHLLLQRDGHKHYKNNNNNYNRTVTSPETDYFGPNLDPHRITAKTTTIRAIQVRLAKRICTKYRAYALNFPRFVQVSVLKALRRHSCLFTFKVLLLGYMIPGTENSYTNSRIAAIRSLSSDRGSHSQLLARAIALLSPSLTRARDRTLYILETGDDRLCAGESRGDSN